MSLWSSNEFRKYVKNYHTNNRKFCTDGERDPRTDFISFAPAQRIGSITKCEQAPSQYKDGVSRYWHFHYKDKTVVRPSYLYNKNPYNGKTTSLYWDGPLCALLCLSFKGLFTNDISIVIQSRGKFLYVLFQIRNELISRNGFRKHDSCAVVKCAKRT